MKVKIVKAWGEPDGVINLWGEYVPDLHIAGVYAEDYGFDAEDFDDKYEITTETVRLK